VRKWLRQQSKDFNAAGFDSLLKRWDKCINVGGGYVEKLCSFQVGISYVLRFISICGLITDSSSYFLRKEVINNNNNNNNTNNNSTVHNIFLI
jgi:hypothetical protein